MHYYLIIELSTSLPRGPNLPFSVNHASTFVVFVVVSSAQTFVVFDPIHLVKFISIVNTVHHVEKNKENV